MNELKDRLQQRSDLHTALKEAIKNAALKDITSVDDFYLFIKKILTHIPTEDRLIASVREFYFLLAAAPGDILRKDEKFSDWVYRVVVARGDFLDSDESAGELDTFINNPKYKIEDYVRGPSGWKTYNQFLARQLKGGKRPIAGLCDDSIIVSPVDGSCKGQLTISTDLSITVKGVSYSIADLLGESSYRHQFEGGLFTHLFLGIENYHYFHTPLPGKVREADVIPGKTWVNEKKNKDGSLENADDVGFQFTHTRGRIILETNLGFVAMIPVGMGHISSVNFTVDSGAKLAKGDSCGFFSFGGSDIILLFEKDKVILSVKAEQDYKQGEEIGRSKP
jgi:phosphatidylserine decarboxylase